MIMIMDIRRGYKDIRSKLCKSKQSCTSKLPGHVSKATRCHKATGSLCVSVSNTSLERRGGKKVNNRQAGGG